MTRLKLFFTVLGCLPIIVFAASQGKVQGTVESFDDYVMVRYMPSRVEFLRGEPVTVGRAFSGSG